MSEFLRPPAREVSRRAIGYWTVRALLGWIVIVAVAAIVLSTTGVPGAGWIIGAVALVAVSHTAVMPRWRFRVHRWEVSPTAVYTQRGWFDQERRVAPLSRIQTVDSERGPLEQVFGLANVTVTTASAAGALKIHGLARADADRVVAQLSEAAEREREDAT